VTSLGLLGIAAFEDQRYQDAVRFWERLVAALPEEDPSRDAIRGGIARAREQMGEPAAVSPRQSEAESAAVTLQVEVALDPEVAKQVSPGDSVFVFARAVSGPAIPLAAKRLTVADLPARVSLGDADAMMPSLKLSNFGQITLVARVSREGNATKGEWLGQSGTLDTAGDQTEVRLTIDRADTP
jgi:cytochrome c-type biogenesis protein CcmH